MKIINVSNIKYFLKYKILRKFVSQDYKEYLNAQIGAFNGVPDEEDQKSLGHERFIDKWMSGYDKKSKILDICCGEGLSLAYFKKLGFENIVGVDINNEKLAYAERVGYKVINQDFHDLGIFNDCEFNIVYCIHSLEHSLYPDKVIKEFYRILKPLGILILVLPYPDLGDWNIREHTAKITLGTDVDDDGNTVMNYISRFKFELLKKEFDSFREPEIWLKYQKK